MIIYWLPAAERIRWVGGAHVTRWLYLAVHAL